METIRNLSDISLVQENAKNTIDDANSIAIIDATGRVEACAVLAYFDAEWRTTLLCTSVHHASDTRKEWMAANKVMEDYYDAFRTHEWEHSDLDTRLAVWHSNTAHTTPMMALDCDPIDTRKIQRQSTCVAM